MAVLSIPAFTAPQAVWFKDPGLTLSQALGIGPSSVINAFHPVSLQEVTNQLGVFMPVPASLWVTKPLMHWAFVCWSLSYTKFPRKMDPLCLLSVTHGKLCLEQAPFCVCCNSASPSYTSLLLKRDPLIPESGRKRYIQIWHWQPFAWYLNRRSTLGGSMASIDEEKLMPWQEVRIRILVAFSAV